MKKKNVLMMALSLCLVAVIAIGGTLAYLTATDGQLVNTFTFAGNITVDLYEYVNGNTESKEQSGASYSDIVADVDYKKDVNIDVDTGTDTYVFIKVGNEGEGMNMQLGGFNTGAWTVQNDATAGDYAIYCTKVTEDTDNLGIFDTVKLVSNSGSVSGTDINKIKIDVFAIQALSNDKVMTATEAYEATGMEDTWGEATFPSTADFEE